MEKDLTIIIPTYNDSIDKIKCTLDSIVSQRKYDFTKLEVIIVDDNSNNGLIDWNEILEKYTCLNIKYIKLAENKGPGMARQVGLDNACGNYIFFLDSGDSLYSLDVLSTFNQNKNIICDIISTRMYDEEKRSKRISFAFNNAYIFGIFIKRQFIQRRNIRFSEILRWEEDAYFEELLRYYNPRVLSLRMISYSYNIDSNSITRNNNHEYQNNFGGFSAMVVKSILLCDFYKKEKAYQCLLDEMFRILAVCYVRFYPYLFGELEISERMKKILYLLRILVQKCNINTDNTEFYQMFVERIYERKFLYSSSIPYDKIYDFMMLVTTCENTYDDYLIEGTNTTIKEFIKSLGLEDSSEMKR